eukprot:SAG31_NODE_33139_length_347_cov_0.963710_1_plen_49_part_01
MLAVAGGKLVTAYLLVLPLELCNYQIRRACDRAKDPVIGHVFKMYRYHV